MIAADTIKTTLSALDIAQAMGIETRHGRCQCPFHNGKDFNCVLSSGNRGWYCHVCKRGGDVISFIQEYYKLSFKDSIAWLNDTFHMGLELDGSINPQKQRQAENALLRRKRAIEFERWKKNMRFNLALTAEDIVRQLEKIRDEKRPRTYGEWDPEFCRAVELLPDARMFAEECMMYCTEAKT